jgi:hypothetical protein
MVIVQYVFLSKALLHFPDAIRVIDTHDVLGGRADRLRAAGLQPSFFYTTEREEARGLARADAVLAIQEEERSELEARSLAPVLTLGHIPGPRPALPAATPGRRFAIGYIGSANPMNVRALRRFLDALDTPALVAAGAEMVVAGGAAQPLAPAAGLRLLGAVADPDELYAQVDLVVNPHEGGTGLKVKTVEALARGRPVIGTAEAFAGLPATAHFHAAPDAAEVAALARRYVAEEPFRQEVAEASARLFRSYAAEGVAARALLARPSAARRPRPRLRAGGRGQRRDALGSDALREGAVRPCPLRGAGGASAGPSAAGGGGRVHPPFVSPPRGGDAGADGARHPRHHVAPRAELPALRRGALPADRHGGGASHPRWLRPRPRHPGGGG